MLYTDININIMRYTNLKKFIKETLTNSAIFSLRNLEYGAPYQDFRVEVQIQSADTIKAS